MIAEISAGLGSLKAAFDITKSLNAANTQASVNEVKIELQQHIIQAQAALSAANDVQTAATERIGKLEQEIVRLKDWSAEKERYELVDTGKGSLAYRLKEGMEAGEPTHWICPNCYQQDKKSILKHEVIPIGRAKSLVCHACGFDIITMGLRPAPSAGTWGRGAR